MLRFMNASLPPPCDAIVIDMIEVRFEPGEKVTISETLDRETRLQGVAFEGEGADAFRLHRFWAGGVELVEMVGDELSKGIPTGEAAGRMVAETFQPNTQVSVVLENPTARPVTVTVKLRALVAAPPVR